LSAGLRALAPCLAAAAALAALAGPAAAGPPSAPSPGPDVGFAPRAGARLATDAVVVTERGEAVALGSLLHGAALVVPVYYRCPNLCDLTLDGVAELVAAAGDAQSAAADAPPTTTAPAPPDALPADVIVLSFAADETPADARALRAALASRHPEVAADPRWHFLTAAPDAIDAITRSIGFRFVRDARSGTYSHVAGVVAVAADGRLLGLLPGVRFGAARLAELVAEREPTALPREPPRVLLWCFDYDPHTGGYTLAVYRVVELASALFAAALAALLLVSIRRRAGRHGP
jgi:protein SCO1/2